MRRIILLSLTTVLCIKINSQVVINEFQVDNSKTYEDASSNEYSDWIELFNTSNQAVDISNYYLTDDIYEVEKWTIPAGTIVEPNDYLIIWCDGKNTGLHTNFKLGKEQECVALYSGNKELVDAYNYARIPEDKSIGRSVDGAGAWVLFENPTPKMSNNGSEYEICKAPEPIFNINGGYFASNQNVVLSSSISNAKIYYTIDGSIPTNSSARYTKPISVSKTTVLKAIVYHENYEPSRIQSNTFFINEHQSDFPVVSIGVDPYDFFDEADGIYSMGNYASSEFPYYGANFWLGIELPATFEYYTPKGNKKVQVNAGVKIFGNWSKGQDQKSLAINCREEYGDERMRYQFFKEKDNDIYKNVVLRNAGVKANSIKYRDMMITDLVSSRMDVDYQAGTPSVVYINGKYWGILNIREKLKERYLKDNYGIEQEHVDLIANYHEVISGSMSDFSSMQDHIVYSDMSQKDEYDLVSTWMDIDEYINYMIAQLYIANRDWPGFNIRYWSNNRTNSPWRWILYDTDQSFAQSNDSDEDYNNLLIAIYPHPEDKWPHPEYSTNIFSNILENKSFRNEFIQRFCAHLNSTFKPENVLAKIEEYENLYANEKPFHLERWGDGESYLWDDRLSEMKDFAELRGEYVKGFLLDEFNLQGLSTLTLKTQNVIDARFQVNNVVVGSNGAVGQYFNKEPFILSVIASIGKKFLHWIDAEGNVVSESGSFHLTMENDMELTAVFGEDMAKSKLYINEIMPNNASVIADKKGENEDWIEIYNGNNYAVDLAGLYITDDISKPLLYEIPQGRLNETVIPAYGHVLLWADSEKKEGALHVELKLNREGEQVALVQNSNGSIQWLDSLTFGKVEENKSYGRVDDGSPVLQVLSQATPRMPNSDKIVRETHVGNYFEFNAFIFPTITRSNVTVFLNEYCSGTCSIISVLGNEVLKSTFDNTNQFFIDVNSLPSGMYSVCVNSNDKKTYCQFLIE